ncbi:hypothetical protein Tco_1431111 [Tanacetum coccineum]
MLHILHEESTDKENSDNGTHSSAGTSYGVENLKEPSSRLSLSCAGVKLPDGFGSCFKHKVTDNDTNITGLKSHDCHIMMQRLLPYGLQNYLPDNIAKPIIELSSLFKQLCSATLMEDDMLKASVKVVEILCELERIYPPAFFDIMIHLPIHLALEALEGGPIHPRWMFPFERFMKKLKGYVRNKAKPEGSIAEGYVAEEALTLSSHYFRDVTTKFNRLERNVDPPPPTCQFQAFRSVCNTIGLRSFPPFGAKEFNKARWYVLHNSPEIDTYRAQFQSLFPEKNMLEEFTGWFRTLTMILAIDEDPLLHVLADSDVEDSSMMMMVVEKVYSSEERRMADVAYGGAHMAGTVDGVILTSTCSTSSVCGKRKAKAQFGRRESRQEDPGKDLEPKVPRGGTKAESVGQLLGQLSFYSMYNLEPHMRSERWPRIEGYIQLRLCKIIYTNKEPEEGAFGSETETRVMIWIGSGGANPMSTRMMSGRNTSTSGNDPANAQRAETNRLNRSKSTVVSRHGSRSIPLTRHLMKLTSAQPKRNFRRSTRFYRSPHRYNACIPDPEALSGCI